MLAPILVFTADEIWENLPLRDSPSVHTELFPSARSSQHQELLSTWERLFAVRDQVLGELEEARIAKQIGSSLEAQVELIAGGESYELLSRYKDELRYLFIVSQVSLVASKKDADGVLVNVRPAEGLKCERCWNYSVHVGESERYPTACERCVAALSEIEQEGEA
jgi:isoleucyl-tRNA synthetase